MGAFGDRLVEAMTNWPEPQTMGRDIDQRVKDLIAEANEIEKRPKKAKGPYVFGWTPTAYSGVTFRSNLEAHWAAFLAKVGARWTYEHKRYEMPKREPYTPDFFLADTNVIVEVKPDVEQANTGKYGDYGPWLVRTGECRMYVLAIGSPRAHGRYTAWWRGGRRTMCFDDLYGDEAVSDAIASIKPALLADDGAK